MSMRFEQELDRSRAPLVGTVLALTMFIFLLGTVWGYGILVERLRTLSPRGPMPLPAEANNVEVGGVLHQPFDAAAGTLTLTAQKRRELSRYGWVDRPNGRIRIPIERAMELVVKEAVK